jgi:PAS domain S-box-containing protein
MESIMGENTTRAVVDLLYRVSREFAGALDLRTVLTRVLFAAINNVGGERGTVVVLDDSGRVIDSAIVLGKQVRQDQETTTQLRDTIDRGLAGWVVRSRQAALIEDTSRDERWLRKEDDHVDRSGSKSAICVPLLAREKLVGVLTLVHPIPKSYNDEHLELMQAIADQAGMAVLNGRLYSESQRQARVMTALAEGAVNMNASLRMDESFQLILTRILQALQVEIAALALIDKPGGDLIFRAVQGANADDLIGQRVRTGEGIIGRVARDGRGLLIPAFTHDSGLAKGETLPNVKIRALACAPIHSRGEVIGVIEAINPTAKTFNPDALLVLTGIGSLAGTTIQNARLFEQLDSAQKRYRELFDDSIDPIVITDWHGKIAEANRKAQEISGYSAEELRQLTISQMHDVNYDKAGEKFERISEAFSYESTLYRKNESRIPVEVHVRKVIFADVESLQWILRDITARKELDGLREDLTAMIYHDLRSPLGNIVSSIELVKTMLPDDSRESAESILEIANQSIGRIQRLISSLLDLNRLESGQPIGARQAVPIDTLITYTIQAAMPGAKGRNQIVNADVALNLPHLFVDPDMIRRVLINLLENAIKYTPEQGRIELGARLEGEMIKIWTQDNGPGIPEADRDRVFEKFTRLKKDGSGGPSGLGVGLAFCRLAVQAHGGNIWIEGGDGGRGSKFVLTLPIFKE